jgi:hypothetical protein
VLANLEIDTPPNQRRRGSDENWEGVLDEKESCVAGRMLATDAMVVDEVGMATVGAMSGELEFEGAGARRNCWVGRAVKRESVIWQEVDGRQVSRGEL